MKKIRRILSSVLYSVKITYAASKMYFIFLFALSIALSLLPFVNIYIWRNVINFLTDMSGYGPGFLVVNIAAYMALYLVTELLSRASDYVSFKYNDRVNIFVENVVVGKCAEVDLSFYDSSELNDRLQNTNDIKYSMTGLCNCGFYLFQSFLSFLVSMILLASLNIWYVFMILLFCIPVFINKLKAEMMDYNFYKENANTNRKMGYFKGLFRNVNNGFDIRLFGLKDLFLGKYADAWTDWYKKRKQTSLKSMVLTFINLIISSFVNQILLYAIIIRRLASKAILIGDATYYISVFGQFYNSAEALMMNLGFLKHAFENLSTVREFLELEPSVQKSGTLKPGDFDDITFDHVDFRYPGKEEYVLRDCSFSIKKGETVGLVGENGSGKSTIVKLLLRFYDVSGGRILIDGTDIKDYDIVKYRAEFSVLFQDFLQYRLTLRENVALSDYGSKGDDEKIRDAIEKSEMSGVVKDWDRGLETSLTRNYDPVGKELSGGQWQRVALARVFFSNHDFIILDEPSASLDVSAEEKIFRQFEQLSNNRSSIIISHRLSSIVNANKIIVLKDGKIVEQGNHGELMNDNGYYAELFSLQASRYITEVAG